VDVATVSQIRTALAAQLAEQVDGLRAYATLPGQISPPAAVVRRRLTVYGTSFGGPGFGTDDLTLSIAVFVGQEQWEVLDGLLAPAGSTSIRAAVDADPTLGGLVDGAQVVRAEEEQLVEYAGVQYLSAALVVDVL
jgi:hypothetical protein